MKQLKFIFVITTLFFVFTNKHQAQGVYVNPGIKIAYQFGQNSGFVYGIEISCTTFLDNINQPESIIGIVLDIDMLKGRPMIHLGVEKNFISIMGLDIGPTIYFAEEKTLIGVTFNYFVGPVLLFGNFSFTKFFGEITAYTQIGLYAKYPLLLHQGKLYDGLSVSSNDF